MYINVFVLYEHLLYVFILELKSFYYYCVECTFGFCM